MPSATYIAPLLPGEIRRAQIAAYVRNVPINAGVTAAVAVFLTFIIAPYTPALPTTLWLGVHLLSATAALWRWSRTRHVRPTRPVSARGTYMAEIWSAYSGAMWGAMALFLPFLDAREQLAVVIVVTSMAAGASSTLAPLPRAAAYYVTAMLLPFVLAFALGGDRTYLALAVLALVFNVAMVYAARRAYATFLEGVEARHASNALTAQFERARSEWLEISDSSEAFALFDSNQQLLLWNSAFVRLWSLPEAIVTEGASRRALLLAGAKPMHQTEQQRDAWLEQHLHLHEHAHELTEQLDNNRWLVSRARRTAHEQLVTVHVDITAIKESEDNLRQKDSELAQSRRLESVGRLAGGVAHDFNNLLTVVMGYAELLIAQAQRNTLKAEWASAAAGEIRAAAERGAGLARELLTFGQRHPTQLERTELNTFVNNAAGMLQRMVSSPVRLHLQLCERPCWVDIDTAQMEQVLLNLATNANDAMLPDGGVLTVSTRVATAHGGEQVVMCVQDGGAGIAEDVLEHIFEPFFTTKAFGHGTGLGLAIVHGIVENLGGRIEVESNLGKGTTFSVLLPLQAPGPIADTAQAPPATLAQTGHGRRILVVEDETNVRSLLAELLTSSGYAVTVAESGEAALRLDATDFDFVISDVIMPGMNGRELLQHMRRQQPQLPALLISGYTDSSADVYQQQLKNVGLLRKPFSHRELVAAIGQQLNGS